MFRKKPALTASQRRLADLLSDRPEARQRVKEIMRIALADPHFWKAGGKGGLIKQTFLNHLGFPPGMSISTISRYWEDIASKGIFPQEWELKPVFVLEALGFDAATWFRLQIRAGKGLITMARILTKMIRAKGGVISVGEFSLKLAVERLLGKNAWKKDDFLELARRDPVAARNKIKQVMETALLETSVWPQNGGKLRKRLLLEELGLVGYRSPTTHDRLWQKLRRMGLWDPLWDGKAAFALQALGYEPLKWITANRRFEHSLKVLAEEINQLLKEGGSSLRVGVDPVKPLRTIALQLNRQK